MDGRGRPSIRTKPPRKLVILNRTSEPIIGGPTKEDSNSNGALDRIIIDARALPSRPLAYRNLISHLRRRFDFSGQYIRLGALWDLVLTLINLSRLRISARSLAGAHTIFPPFNTAQLH
jgi:hypothetical protein